MLELIILSLATWRVSYMLVEEQGPAEIFDKLRYKIGVQHTDEGVPFAWNWFAELFTCVWCMSVWVGTIFFVVDALTGWAWVGIPFALSALSILIHEVIDRLRHV